MNQTVLVVLVALVALAIGAGVGAWVGAKLRRHEDYVDGKRAGYSEGYEAMNRIHQEYRGRNRAMLRMVQSLTPDDPATELLAAAPATRTFDTSGAFDVHLESENGNRAVGRAATLEQAQASALRYLERNKRASEVVITRPGADGPRVAVCRVLAHRNDDGELIAHAFSSANVATERRAPASAELPHEIGDRA